MASLNAIELIEIQQRASVIELAGLNTCEVIDMQQKALFGCQDASWKLTVMYFIAEDYLEAFYWVLRTKKAKDADFKKVKKLIRESLSLTEKNECTSQF